MNIGDRERVTRLFSYYGKEWEKYGTKKFILTRLFYLRSKISRRYRKWFRLNIKPVWEIEDSKLISQWRSKSKVKTLDILTLLQEWEEEIKKSFFISSSDKVKFSRFMAEKFPEKVEASLRNAEDIMNNTYDLLGSGPTKLQEPLPWDTDIKTGHRYGGYSQDIYHENMVDSTDAKVPWELSRFSFASVLGKAYWYTGEEKYAEKYVSLFSDWLEKNPYDWGVNWICAMEAAIRPLGMMWGYFFFSDSPHFDQRLKIKLIKSLIQHAHFIMGNLEGNPYGESNNHYFTNGFGLFFMGIFLKKHAQGLRWLSAGLKIIERETLKQVFSDGVHYEQSTGYHRLILDILLSTVILSRKNNIELSSELFSRLEKMLDFTLDYSEGANSSMVADCDDGRLTVLEASMPKNDHRGVLSTGSTILKNSRWKTGVFCEETFWLTGIEGWKTFTGLKAEETQKSSRAYEKGGYYIMKSSNIRIVADCGPYGFHGHNDLLGFDMYAFARPMLCDPGTYVYSSNYRWRNWFRSTYSHNVVGIDGKEICPLYGHSADHFWGFDKENKYERLAWISNGDFDLLEAKHFNYAYIQKDIVHHRKMLLDKREETFFICDDVLGSGIHTVLLVFNAADGLEAIEESTNGTVILRDIFILSKGVMIVPLTPTLSDEPELKLKIKRGWISYEFGRKIPTKKIYYIIKTKLPFSMKVAIIPFDSARYKKELGSIHEVRKRCLENPIAAEFIL